MKKSVPPFLKKGGGTKIAKGDEPSGAKSVKLPPFRPSSGKPKKPGVSARGK